MSEPPSIETFIDYARQFVARHKLTYGSFARLAGLNKNTLNNMGEKTWNPNVSTLRALRAAMIEYERETAEVLGKIEH